MSVVELVAFVRTESAKTLWELISVFATKDSNKPDNNRIAKVCYFLNYFYQQGQLIQKL